MIKIAYFLAALERISGKMKHPGQTSPKLGISGSTIKTKDREHWAVRDLDFIVCRVGSSVYRGKGN